ncbi:MAG: hypothetical protein EB059_00360 [Alphaproteobacteria bacterium]|nr:hypothetical protein [Alphaproteobacteria bacterium]
MTVRLSGKLFVAAALLLSSCPKSQVPAPKDQPVSVQPPFTAEMVYGGGGIAPGQISTNGVFTMETMPYLPVFVVPKTVPTPQPK